ncbi:MAG TPA: LytTR family DNA-binding domain-containing protein [Vicinamibacterales bacterium]|nr:LytTR family DNA-binding domain-containing protein [Vicinamibacterales bacterium]
MIRTLLIDDEQPARERLKQLLSAHPDIAVVGEAGDGIEAAERIAEHAPDLILLDIQMPGASGLDVAASLGQPRPSVIFCTAFDQYAVDAFELSALDYLLKPVNRARLAAALDKVRASTSKMTGARDRPLEKLTQTAGLAPTRFLARRGARFRVVPANEVVAFTFVDGITHLRTATEQLSMQPTLASLARRLDPAQFFQVSRSAIVRLDAITEAKPFSDGTGEIILANGQTMIVARRRWRELLDRLEA